MENKEIMLECMKLGLALTSPTVSNRQEEVVKSAKMIYSEIIAVDFKSCESDTLVTEGRKKPGPKPKPRD
jgi:hypothetical protein